MKKLMKGSVKSVKNTVMDDSVKQGSMEYKGVSIGGTTKPAKKPMKASVKGAMIDASDGSKKKA